MYSTVLNSRVNISGELDECYDCLLNENKELQYTSIDYDLERELPLAVYFRNYGNELEFAQASEFLINNMLFNRQILTSREILYMLGEVIVDEDLKYHLLKYNAETKTHTILSNDVIEQVTQLDSESFCHLAFQHSGSLYFLNIKQDTFQVLCFFTYHQEPKKFIVESQDTKLPHISCEWACGFVQDLRYFYFCNFEAKEMIKYRNFILYSIKNKTWSIETCKSNRFPISKSEEGYTFTETHFYVTSSIRGNNSKHGNIEIWRLDLISWKWSDVVISSKEHIHNQICLVSNDMLYMLRCRTVKGYKYEDVVISLSSFAPKAVKI